MELICRDIESLALVFPGVSFTLSAIRRPSEVGSLTDRVLNIPKVFGDYLRMFLRAHNGTVRHRPYYLPFVTSMVEPSPMCVRMRPWSNLLSLTLAQEVDEISMSSGTMNLEGFISLRGALTKVKWSASGRPLN
jgi:hypothetical protein